VGILRLNNQIVGIFEGIEGVPNMTTREIRILSIFILVKVKEF